MSFQEFNPTYISTNTTTAIEANSRVIKLHTVVIPKATAGTVTFQDKAGTTYFVLPAASIGTLIFDVNLPNGLSVVTASADTIIVNTAKL